jgi:pantoate--beta-alanine ligase
MKIINSIDSCRKEVGILSKRGISIGLVPTMGYLHEGHLSLVRLAKKECGRVFVSIFVNPSQFGPQEDFERYPRDPRRDERLSRESGVDYIFRPAVEEMYKDRHSTHVEAGEISNIMCGRFRTGHFRGVATIVLKLINIIPAQKAYFGTKDYQQLVIIKKMVSDLNINIKIIGGPTVREEDGLALSSRNKYLDPEERVNAAIIYKSLKIVENGIISGGKNMEKLRKKAIQNLLGNKYVRRIDYFDIRDAQTLEEVRGEGSGKDILAAAAVWIGKTRLIDNIVIERGNR